MSRFGTALRDLYHERTNYQFIERSWRWAVLSGVLIAISFGALAIRGLNFGIDFTGGTAWEVQVEGDRPSTNAVRDALRPFGIADAKISFREDRGSGSTTLLVQATEHEGEERRDVAGSLEEFGTIQAISEVGPTWGESVSRQAWRALVAFFVAIGIYLALRFEWRMSAAALVAVFHDIIITVGAYAILGAQVAPATIIAFLTILGFSLYDTVVVFDKVKEYEETLGAERTDTYSDMVNRALNRVLSRSLNTTLTSVLPILSIMIVGVWYLGAVALSDFALALLVGVVVGTYSSLFVAAPVLAWINERRPKHRALRERSAGGRGRGGRQPVGVRAGVEDVGALAAAEREAVADRIEPQPDVGADVGAEAEARGPSAPTPSPKPSPASTSGITPRPRRQRRRKRR